MRLLQHIIPRDIVHKLPAFKVRRRILHHLYEDPVKKIIPMSMVVEIARDMSKSSLYR